MCLASVVMSIRLVGIAWGMVGWALVELMWTVCDLIGAGNANSRDVMRIRDDHGVLHLLKPLQRDERGLREVLFYQTISPSFARFTPHYYGLYKSKDSNQFHISIQDCVAGMRFPCVADIKIGRVTYDETATEDKIKRETANYEWQSEIGFRFVGIKTYQQNDGSYIVHGKPFGKSINPSTVDLAWNALFGCGHSNHVKKSIAESILSRLQSIASFMRNQEEFRLCSSSLLIAFDGEKINDASSVKSDVHMIDFGHAIPIKDVGDRDENYVFGVNRLIKSLQSYIDSGITLV